MKIFVTLFLGIFGEEEIEPELKPIPVDDIYYPSGVLQRYSDAGIDVSDFNEAIENPSFGPGLRAVQDVRMWEDVDGDGLIGNDYQKNS